MTKTFKELGLSENLLQAIAKKGFEKPSPIQAKAIPALLKGDHDIIGQAQTGTGKTAAFGLPIIDKLDPNANSTKALIVCPTRELARQVSNELKSFTGKKKLSICPIYGGQSYGKQLRALKKGVDIVVGTPGRIIDHIKRKTLKLHDLDYLILDEADEMLNMGFKQDIEKILQNSNKNRRLLFFSATMPRAIMSIAKKFMTDQQVISVKSQKKTTDLVEHTYMKVKKKNRLEVLTRLIDIQKDFYGIVFCKTRNDVDEYSSKLKQKGYSTDGLHGQISQSNRQKILKKFKTKKINILVATDVASRGIDVDSLTHVINFEIPQSAKDYVHRTGRTGRAGNEGKAITLVSHRQAGKLKSFVRKSKKTIKKESIPTIQETIAAQKDELSSGLMDTVKTGKHKNHLNLADELLDSHDAKHLIAALLYDKLSEDSDGDINDSSSETYPDSNRDDGKMRLFFAIGRKDGLGAKKFVNLIKSKAGTYESKIEDVAVHDDFSFCTVPNQESKFIFQAFNDGRSKRPTVEQAKPR